MVSYNLASGMTGAGTTESPRRPGCARAGRVRQRRPTSNVKTTRQSRDMSRFAVRHASPGARVHPPLTSTNPPPTACSPAPPEPCAVSGSLDRIKTPHKRYTVYMASPDPHTDAIGASKRVHADRGSRQTQTIDRGGTRTPRDRMPNSADSRPQTVHGAARTKVGNILLYRLPLLFHSHVQLSPNPSRSYREYHLSTPRRIPFSLGS